jgi:hypothetical protein
MYGLHDPAVLWVIQADRIRAAEAWRGASPATPGPCSVPGRPGAEPLAVARLRRTLTRRTVPASADRGLA